MLSEYKVIIIVIIIISLGITSILKKMSKTRDTTSGIMVFCYTLFIVFHFTLDLMHKSNLSYTARGIVLSIWIIGEICIACEISLKTKSIVSLTIFIVLPILCNMIGTAEERSREDFENTRTTECNELHQQIEIIEIVSAIDTTMVQGKISSGGFIIHQSSSEITEDSVYRYYYRLEDGGIKQGEIPENHTTIYFIEEDQTPYIEVVIPIECDGYYVKTGEHIIYQNASLPVTYNLYVPHNSIINTFQFDGM